MSSANHAHHESASCPTHAGKWDKGRFDNIVNGLTPFLKSCGYNLKKEVGPLLPHLNMGLDAGASAGLRTWKAKLS